MRCTGTHTRTHTHMYTHTLSDRRTRVWLNSSSLRRVINHVFDLLWHWKCHSKTHTPTHTQTHTRTHAHAEQQDEWAVYMASVQLETETCFGSKMIRRPTADGNASLKTFCRSCPKTTCPVTSKTPLIRREESYVANGWILATLFGPLLVLVDTTWHCCFQLACQLSF